MNKLTKNFNKHKLIFFSEIESFLSWWISRTIQTLLMALFVVNSAAYANILVNGDFETDVTLNQGNNINLPSGQPTGWNFETGDDPNLVKVDGPGGYDYGVLGVKSCNNTF